MGCFPGGISQRRAAVLMAVAGVAFLVLFRAPSAFALNCTQTGTSGNDSINGTPGADVICGLGGDDTLDGLDGDDTLVGGTGDDTLVGEAGNDHLLGEAGIDSAYGGYSDSRVEELNDDDFISGGPGADYLDGDMGKNTVSYGSSPRVIGTVGSGPGTGVTVDLTTGATAGAGTDAEGDVFADSDEHPGVPSFTVVIGSAFGDSLTARNVTTYLRGGSGDDSLAGRDGSDVLAGGPGADWLDGGPTPNSLSEPSQDKIEYPGSPRVIGTSGAGPGTGVSVNLSTGKGSGAGTDAQGDRYALGTIEYVQGSEFGDRLTGDGLDNLINGLRGVDTLQGRAGDDSLIAHDHTADSKISCGPGVAAAERATFDAGLDPAPISC
jgi:Ca2+-binding RTX toxin-like protein